MQMISQAKVASDMCSTLEQNILSQEFKLRALEDKIRTEKTRYELQTSKLRDLEKNLHSAFQMNENLQQKHQATQNELEIVKLLIQQNEIAAKKRENQLSVQMMVALENLGSAEKKIKMFQQTEKDLEITVEKANQLQNQLFIEEEKVIKLEMQLRDKRVPEKVDDPVEQSMHPEATTPTIKANLNEADVSLDERVVTLSLTEEASKKVDLKKNDSSAKLSMAQSATEESISEGTLYASLMATSFYFSAKQLSEFACNTTKKKWSRRLISFIHSY